MLPWCSFLVMWLMQKQVKKQKRERFPVISTRWEQVFYSSFVTYHHLYRQFLNPFNKYFTRRWGFFLSLSLPHVGTRCAVPKTSSNCFCDEDDDTREIRFKNAHLLQYCNVFHLFFENINARTYGIHHYIVYLFPPSYC